MKYLISSAVLIFFFGCAQTELQKEISLNPTENKTPTAIKGHYTWGHEVNTFTPCGAKKTFWVEGSESSIKKLKDKHQAQIKKPYGNVYAEVSASFNLSKEDRQDSFAEQYDGLITIDSVHKMDVSKRTDCK